jgi:hypothetical protein
VIVAFELAVLVLALALLVDFLEQPATAIARRIQATVRLSLLVIFEKISFGSEFRRDGRENPDNFGRHCT